MIYRIMLVVTFLFFGCMEKESKKNGDDYEILPRQVLYDLLVKRKKEKDFKSVNLILSLYKLEKSKYVLLANNPSQKYGFLFYDKIVLDSMLKIEKFPLEPAHKEFYEHEVKMGYEKMEILTKKYLNYINNKYHLNIREKSTEDYNYLIQNYFNKVTEKLTPVEKISLVILLGNIINEKYNSKWLYIKFYNDFNSYYEPCILFKNGGYINICSSLLHDKLKVQSVDQVIKHIDASMHRLGKISLLKKLNKEYKIEDE